MSANIIVSSPLQVPDQAPAARSMPGHSPLASVCLLLSDSIALSAIFWLAVWTKYIFDPTLDFKFYLEIFPSILIFLGVFFSQSLYPGMLLHPAEEIRRIFHSMTAVLLILASATFLRKSGADYSRFAFLVVWAAGTPAVFVGRAFIRKLFGKLSWWPMPVIVLGSSTAARQVAQSLQDRNLGLRIAGVVLDQPVTSWDTDLPPVIGHLSEMSPNTAHGLARYAILAMTHRSPDEIRQIIQDHCRGFHRILIVTDVPGICCLGISPREIGGQVGLEIPQRLGFLIPRVMKRSMDFAVSASLLLALTPLLLLICLAIKLTSRGPVLFGHLRYGRNAKLFRALKFRTMVTNADLVLETYLRAHPEMLSEWQRDHKLKNDPRVTRVGRWLRRYSLDELPQLLNILVGHMSLVGPRPIVESEIVRYANSFDLYKRVPPGLTGLWQVSGRNNTTYRERVAFDDYYIRNWSIWMDMYILARTFQAVVQAEGAY
jgi:Undecaprenyl-phosphate galactose phosphotransferase WbaP